MESVHHLMKVVSGAPNIRPAWFFDTDEQGEGLNDIGTHLVDLVQWTLFPNRPIDYRADVKVLSAYRWPTMIPEADFKRVTASAWVSREPGVAREGRGAGVFLQHLRHLRHQGRPHRPQRAVGLGGASGCRRHPLRGLQGVTRESRGTAVEGRQLPHRGLRRAQRRRGSRAGAGRGAGPCDGTAGPVAGHRRRRAPRRDSLSIPEASASDTRRILPRSRETSSATCATAATVPAWEQPNMLAKYYVTTTGTELSHKAPVKVARRMAP